MPGCSSRGIHFGFLFEVGDGTNAQVWEIDRATLEPYSPGDVRRDPLLPEARFPGKRRSSLHSLRNFRPRELAIGLTVAGSFA